jgi:hypothetical protein
MEEEPKAIYVMKGDRYEPNSTDFYRVKHVDVLLGLMC